MMPGVLALEAGTVLAAEAWRMAFAFWPTLIPDSWGPFCGCGRALPRLGPGDPAAAAAPAASAAASPGTTCTQSAVTVRLAAR